MSTKMKTYMILGLSFLLVGCGGTMYFYETEKISLTVEARPDSSQPVQGSLGIKQRVVLVAPKKKDGEAVSAISSFNFKIIPRPWTPFNAVLVQTAFVTGDAASGLSDLQAEKVAKAITLDGVEINSFDKPVNCIIDKTKTDADKFNTLKQIARNDDFTRLSDEEWEKLKPELIACHVLARNNFKESLRKSLQKELINRGVVL